MQNVASYFMQRLPEGMSYPDAEQFCLRLYCTADGMPQELRPQLSRIGLADTFAELARTGWIHGGDQLRISVSNYWDELIVSLFKRGFDVVDFARAEELMKRIG